MLGFRSAVQLAAEHYRAISSSHAIIWFSPEGLVQGANENFCKALGYAPEEIVGRHHRMFVEEAHTQTSEYQRFWRDLAAGKAQRGQFRRISKTGADVWIEASYDPIIRNGKVVGVVKIAADITTSKVSALHNESILKALERSVGVIEFDTSGVIVDANKSFCAVVGYDRADLVGQRHSMLCEPEYATSKAYELFWQKLRAGEFFSDTFRRLGKGGREVWIQATYNPVFNTRGEIYRIVSREQSVGIKEIGEAVMQLDHGTQQNAASVEEQNAASSQLADRASDIAVLIGQFTTRSSGVGHSLRRRAA